VLNIQCGDNVDLCGQQLLHVFVSLAVLAAGDVGVGEFVDQDDCRTARQNCVDIHLLEHGTLVFDLPARHLFHLRDQFFDALASMRFHHADDHVFAAAPPAQRLAQHAEGFTNAWRVT
jgi:hypothetical protein